MITGLISVQDFLRGQRLHRRPIAIGSHVFVAVLMVFGAAALFFAPSPHLGLACLGAGIGGLIGELVTSQVYLPRKVRRLHAQQKDLASPFSYEWDEGHLTARGASGSARRPWSNYVKLKEDEHLFLLYHADNLFEMFPKSWFPTPEAMAEFRRLAEAAGKG